MRAKHLTSILVCLLVIVTDFSVTFGATESVILSERKQEINMVMGEKVQIFVDVHRQMGGKDDSSTLLLNVDIDLNTHSVLDDISLKQPVSLTHESSFPIWIRAKSYGVVSLIVHTTTNDSTIKLSTTSGEDLHYIVFVGKFRSVQYLSSFIGWFYVVLWVVSSWPQLIHNFRRKSVLGVAFDTLALNTVGHTCYMVYNIGLYGVPSVKEEYHRRHPFGINPVKINDIFFPLQTLVTLSIAIYQCCSYERGTQKVSKLCRILVGCFLLLIADRLYLALQGTVSWLDWLYFLSTVKIAITLIKYIPQAYYNYRRQSTKGVAIQGVLGDHYGGVFSLLQMFIDAWNNDDWTSLYGNGAKLGLGGLSILFTSIFIFQHFYLYRNNDFYDRNVKYVGKDKYKLLEERSNED